MYAAGLTELFLNGIFFGEVGVAEKDAVLGQVGGSLGERAKRGDAGIKDIETARAIAGKGVDDVGEHGARGFKAEGSRFRILKEGGLEVVVDGGSHNYVRHLGRENALLEIFCHQEIVVELEMAAVLFGFRTLRDDDDGRRSEGALGFVPGKIFEKNRVLLCQRDI